MADISILSRLGSVNNEVFFTFDVFPTFGPNFILEAQAEDVEKAVPIESNHYGQSGPSGSTSNVLTISGETIRTTPDEFFGLEAPPPVRLSFENDIRKSGKESDHVTLAKGPSSI